MPKLTASLPPSTDPSALVQIDGLGEVLLEHRDLARIGVLDDHEIDLAARNARRAGLTTVLVWDLLAGDRDIERGAEILGRLDLTCFNAIRAQDPGIALLLRERFPDLDLHLVLETGNHNLAGIRAWICQLQPRRVVISNEIPIAQLAAMRAEIEAEVECLALGRILIFYSPRQLVSPFDPSFAQSQADQPSNSPWEEAVQRYATSVEDRKHFPVVENRHGTFMFYEKELFLLPYLDEFDRAGVDFVRLDLKFYDGATLLPALAAYMSDASGSALDHLKRCLGPRLTRGFFKSNRTDKQFTKLKNRHLTRRADQTLAGTVIDAKKGSYIAIQTEAPLEIGQVLEFVIPEGLAVFVEISWIRDLAGRQVSHADGGRLWLINPASRISSGAKAYFSQS